MKKVGIVINQNKKSAKKIYKSVINWCNKNSLSVRTDLDFIRSDIAQWADTIIAIGGDGTLINIARQIRKTGTSVLGINIGGLGFLTEIKQNEIFETLKNLKSDKAKFSVRKIFISTLHRENKEIFKSYFINDAVIQRGATSRILSLTVFTRCEEVVSYICDGLIVSTPTGSTAHSLSANGPIIHPGVRGFVITPICPHILSNRSIVLPEEKAISVKIDENSEAKNVALMIDGQEGFAMKSSDRMNIKYSNIKINLVMSEKRTYFQMLKEKLYWGVRKNE